MLKSRQLIALLIVGALFSFNAMAQNWNVFNKTYRYNYVYNNNAIVTNVLFIDSIKQIGNDTAYYLNRIGVECSGTCPTITTAISGTATVIVPNMPQFLQRSIIKYANGIVMLKDTAKLVLKPNCILNETWLFDSINTKMAQCISIGTQTIFTIADSVKTILIDGTDSLVLSKKFGIIQFPNVYNKNKYYRLVGIENLSTYDQAALYGTKVPNAWDFYDFSVGDKFCYHNETGSFCGMGCYNSSNQIKTIDVQNKNVTPGVGYSYTVNIKTQTTYFNSGNTSFSITNSISNLSYANTTNTLVCNKIYPGQITSLISAPASFARNFVKYGTDNFSKFYKYAGPNCQAYSPVIVPGSNTPWGYIINNGIYYPVLYYSDQYYISFGVGLGKLTETYAMYFAEGSECLTCAIKSGALYLGTEVFVGIEEKGQVIEGISIYPNPSSNEVYIESQEPFNGSFQISIANCLGETIYCGAEMQSDNKIKLNVTDLASGIYFVQYQNPKATVRKKIIVSR